MSNLTSISLDLDGLEKLETMMEISDDDEYQFLASIKQLLDLVSGNKKEKKSFGLLKEIRFKLSDNATDLTETLISIDFCDFIGKMQGLENVQVYEIDGYATNHKNQYLNHLEQFQNLKKLKISYFDNLK